MKDWTVVTKGVLYHRRANMYAFLFHTDKRVIMLRNAVPHLVWRKACGVYMVLLPCQDDTIRLLENMGLPVAGLEPYRRQYRTPLAEGRYQPMAHQVTTAAFCAVHHRGYVTSTMRTGKTFSMIACLDYLQRVARVPGAALIVATVSNLTGVWYNSLCSTLPDKKVVVVHGGTGKADRLRRLRTPADYYVINYDGVKMVKDELMAMTASGRITRVVVDELTHYANISSARWKAMNAVLNSGKGVPYVWGLTGSPGDNPIAIFGMCKLINPQQLPCQKLGTWRDMTQYKFGPEAWQWRNKPECAQLIYSAMQPNIRFDKADIMDLPPIVRQLRDCELSSEQEAAYKQLKDEMMTILESGETIEAVHKASLAGKLFQVALGTAISGDRHVQLDNKKRVDTVVECIKEASQKVVIFCSYTGVTDRLCQQLTERGYSCEIVDGRITGKKRTKIFSDFQNAKDPHILICHPQTTAFGVELAAADTMIFNGPPLSGEVIYAQALERLSSLKQQARQIAIIQIAATREERNFFSGLDNGTKASMLINNMFAELTQKQHV